MSLPILSATLDEAKAMLPLITVKGRLRATKPKDGNAAYVWRMVSFMVSSSGPNACMPVTADFGVIVPPDYLVEAPQDWIEAECKRCTFSDEDYVKANSPDGTKEGYFRQDWSRYSRRHHYIKHVLDPIYKDIVDQLKANDLGGVRRWGRALGYL